MFDLIKPQLVAMMASAIAVIQAKAEDCLIKAESNEYTKEHQGQLLLRSGLWADVADMIRKGIAAP